jgi:O-antigen/teichoic acid export membrane protein
MRSLPQRFRRNAISNYATSITSLVIALVITPVLVRGLGKDAYGLWVIVASTAFYFELLRFGFGSAAVKFVAEGWALHDLERVRRVISTAVLVLAVPGLLLAVTGPLLALAFPLVFDVPEGLETAAFLLVIIVALDLSFAIPSDTLGSSLIGLQRYDALSMTVMGQAIVQAVGWIVILALGGGVVALALMTLAVNVLAQGVRFLWLRRLVPGVAIARRFFDRNLVRPIASFSGWVGATDLSDVVINRVDLITVGVAVGVPEAGIYSVGQKLVWLIPRFVSPIVQMYFPHSSELAAKGDMSALRASFVTGTRICVAIAAPLALVLGILAGPTLDAWVGQGFADAVPVVVYLSAAAFVYAFAQAGLMVLRGMGDVRRPALIRGSEAVLNAGLSIALGITIGLDGVALATLIAAGVTQLGVLVPYSCRRTGVSLFGLVTSLLRAHLLPIAAATLVGLLIRNAGGANLVVVLLGALAMLATYAAVFSITGVSGEERRLILTAVLRHRGSAEASEAP